MSTRKSANSLVSPPATALSFSPSIRHEDGCPRSRPPRRKTWESTDPAVLALYQGTTSVVPLLSSFLELSSLRTRALGAPITIHRGRGKRNRGPRRQVFVAGVRGRRACFCLFRILNWHDTRCPALNRISMQAWGSPAGRDQSPRPRQSPRSTLACLGFAPATSRPAALVDFPETT